MLAARWHGRGDVRVEDIPDPGPPPPGWVRVHVSACGICGTDVEEYTSGPVMIPTGAPNKLSGRSAPLTLGHEVVGVIAERGKGVRLPVGARVAVEANLYCGSCYWCRRGEHQLCPDLASLGLMGDGGLAEVMLAPAKGCVPYGDHVPPEHAALAEPLSVVLRAIRRARLGPGCSLAVVGTGPIGLLMLQAARLAGAQTLLAVDRVPERRELALRCGATAATAPEDAAAVAAELTGGIGVDVAVEAAGNPAAASFAVELARRGGRAVLLGVFDAPVAFDMREFLLGEKEVLASLSHVVQPDFRDAVALLEQEAIDAGPIISNRIALEDVVTHGFKALVASPQGHQKIIVTPDGNDSR